MQTAVAGFTLYTGLHPQAKLSTSSRQPVVLPRRGSGLPLVLECKVLTKEDRRVKRHRRIRNKVEGTGERPRLSVYRSENHIYAQVIDDHQGFTLAAVSTLTPDIRSALEGSSANKEAAQLVGKKLAELCLAKNIEKVAFDRGGYLYHGRVKALADAAREGGLNF